MSFFNHLIHHLLKLPHHKEAFQPPVIHNNEQHCQCQHCKPEPLQAAEVHYKYSIVSHK